MKSGFTKSRYFIEQETGETVHKKDQQQRTSENFYRYRWQHDKEVRSTHGVNCTGSCSWKIFVKKGGVITLTLILILTLTHILFFFKFGYV